MPTPEPPTVPGGARVESSQGWSGSYEDDTRRHYQRDDVAAQYAAALQTGRAARVVTRLERRAVARALADLALPPGGTVLDVPAGTGKLTSDLRPGRTYVAADISAAMLGWLPDVVDRVVADATALPLPDSSIDVVVSVRLYHRVPEDVLARMLTEAVRVARHGVVVSFAGRARSAVVHRAIRAVTRRPASNATVLDRQRLRELVDEAGAELVSDRSISAGVTTERVAAVRPR